MKEEIPKYWCDSCSDLIKEGPFNIYDGIILVFHEMDKNFGEGKTVVAHSCSDCSEEIYGRAETVEVWLDPSHDTFEEIYRGIHLKSIGQVEHETIFSEADSDLQEFVIQSTPEEIKFKGG